MNSGWKSPVPEGWVEQMWAALAEDIGSGDPTAALFEPDALVDWVVEAQGDGVLCGAGIAHYLLQPESDEPDSAYCELHAEDGQSISHGTKIVSGRSHPARVLARERTALNFLMLLSGVATLTSQFIQKVEGLSVQIVDTRKTIPEMRALQKYAVRCGGGKNHRMGLFDGIMLKDNHIKAAGSVIAAIEKAKLAAGHMTMIEVECESEEQVAEALQGGADIVMLDNMNPFEMAEIVRKYKGRAILEASGSVTLETVRGVAQTGVDAISVGALTHSAKAVPFHLEVE